MKYVKTKHVMTKHVTAQLSQRGFQTGDLDVIMENGTETADGIFIRRKDVARAVNEIKQDTNRRIKKLERLQDTYVVMKEGSIITIYRPGNRKQKKIFRHMI